MEGERERRERKKNIQSENGRKSGRERDRKRRGRKAAEN